MSSSYSASHVVPKSSYRHWLIWGLAASFFFFEYVVRVSPSVMAPWLMHDFNTNALGIGVLAAMFYYPYIAMQLPVGVLVDRWGAQQLLVWMSALCAVACLVFTYAPNLWLASAARACLGFGSAFAFVGTLKLISTSFPARQFALLASCTQAMGMFGAAMGEAPMAWMVHDLGWQSAMFSCAIVFAVLACALYCSAGDGHGASGEKSLATDASPELMAGLKYVTRQPVLWLNGAFAGLLFASSAAFAELWGVTYLSHAFALTQQQAANAIVMIFIGWGCGAPYMGWLIGRLSSRRPLRLASALSGAVVMGALLSVTHLSYFTLCAMMLFYGVSNSGLMVAYVSARELVPSHIAGASLAFANMASVIIGSALQPVIGALLDWHWAGVSDSLGHRIYDQVALHSALIVLPLCFVAAFVVAWFIPDVPSET